jgi:hypothetical protein
MQKKKIGIFITDKEFVRNFINTGIVNKISKNNEVYVFYNENLAFNLKKLTNCKSITKYNNSQNEQRHQFNNKINLWRNRKKAISFKARILESYRIDKKRFIIFNNISLIKFFFFALLKLVSFFIDLIKFCIINILSWNIFYYFYRYVFANNIKINNSLHNALNKKKIELIIAPTSGHNADALDLIKIGKIEKIPSYLIIDNWDNLSSKVYYDKLKPDYVSCWGKQSLIHGKKIHKLVNIDLIGSARFDFYFNKRKLKQKKIFDFPYVLFLGSSLKWNEEEALQILDQHIERNKNKFKNLKIIYRPHPKRLDFRNQFNALNYKNILLDPQILQTKSREWPELFYYPKILSNCLFVVGGPTSMIIESTIFHKNYIVISYDDKNFLWNGKYVKATRPHLFEINNLDNINLCHSRKNLTKLFDKNFLNKNKLINPKKIDKQRSFFLFHDKYKFEQRLEIKIKKIFENEKNL